MSDAPHPETDSAKSAARADSLFLRRLALGLAALVGTIVVLLIGGPRYFQGQIDQELLHKDLARVDPVLKELRLRGQATLGEYRVVDADKGVYRIPIARAIDLLVANPSLLVAQPAPPATQPAATTQPAEAAERLPSHKEGT